MEWLADTPSRNASVGLRAAWAHEFASNDAGDRSFQALPAVGFSASGAASERDSINLSATASLFADNGVYVDTAIRTDFSSVSQDYSASLKVGYRW